MSRPHPFFAVVLAGLVAGPALFGKSAEAQVTYLASEKAPKPSYFEVEFANDGVVFSGRVEPDDVGYAAQQLIKWARTTGRSDLQIRLDSLKGDRWVLEFLGAAMWLVADRFAGLEWDVPARCHEICDALMAPPVFRPDDPRRRMMNEIQLQVAWAMRPPHPVKIGALP